jgi:hypothetical protein
MADVNREVKISLSVEGEKEAREKIDNLIKGVGGSRSSGSSADPNRSAIRDLNEDEKRKREAFRDLNKELKETTNPLNSMRKELTGMLIWMHTFRVFGEYSAVLKNQFTMLGNSLGMIMNQFLIPIYPLLIGITVVFYKIADAVRLFFKYLGNIPSLLLATSLAVIVLTKLFWGTWVSLNAFKLALDANTASLAGNTAAKGGGIMSAIAANPVAIGAALGLIGVLILQQTGVLKAVGKAGEWFRKNITASYYNWVKTIFPAFINSILKLGEIIWNALPDEIKTVLQLLKEWLTSLLGKKDTIGKTETQLQAGGASLFGTPFAPIGIASAALGLAPAALNALGLKEQSKNIAMGTEVVKTIVVNFNGITDQDEMIRKLKNAMNTVNAAY